MRSELKVVWAAGLVVLLLLVALVALSRGSTAQAQEVDHYRGRPRQQMTCDGGPYNLQLYDAVRAYPFYDGREALWWDANSRCSTWCRGCRDSGRSADVPGCCTTWCR